MSPARRVAAAPEKPLVVFDGDCAFCRLWIARWESITAGRVKYAPSDEVAGSFPEIPKGAFDRAMQLVLPSGEVFEGAEAVFRALTFAPRRGRLLWMYRALPGFAPIARLLYRFIARHRSAGFTVTRFLWGTKMEKPTFFLASALFLRLLGLCYFVAFLSLWPQVDGLVGSRGILPVARLLDVVRAHTGSERYWLLPTLCWLDSGDGFLNFLCGGGALLSLVLIAGFAPAPCLALLWLFYLSLSVAGQEFLAFQWDILLLEAGFLAIFLAPLNLRLRRGFEPPAAPLLLLRWLLFRLMFSSGFAKLASGDPTWRNLSALRYHYETQPLPPWTAWFMHQLPSWFQTASVLVMFFVELAVPFLIFAPRRLRLFAFGAMVAFQVLIAAAGNYAFFNLLAVALSVLLLDDATFARRWRERAHELAVAGRHSLWRAFVTVPVAGVILLVSAVQMSGTLRRSVSWPSGILRLARAVLPFRSVNSYGLFSVMTTSRPEILVEGSDDGSTWLAYEFRWKPGDLKRRPRFVAPHQPRLDWQMWFAALGSYEENPWLINFLARLLQGSPEVTRLLKNNPFPNGPPGFIRAVLYDYHFTDPATHRKTGAWWRPELKGLYCPVLSREMLRSFAPSPLAGEGQGEVSAGENYTPKRSGSQARPSSPGGAM